MTSLIRVSEIERRQVATGSSPLTDKRDKIPILVGHSCLIEMGSSAHKYVILPVPYSYFILFNAKSTNPYTVHHREVVLRRKRIKPVCVRRVRPSVRHMTRVAAAPEISL